MNHICNIYSLYIHVHVMWINNYLSPIIKTIVIIIAQVAESNDYIVERMNDVITLRID
jgi:hypothetical protein